MEDILYILLGVAWIAYSIYSQGQKQKKKQLAKAMQDERKPEGLEEMSEKEFSLEEFFGIEKTENADYKTTTYSESAKKEINNIIISEKNTKKTDSSNKNLEPLLGEENPELQIPAKKIKEKKPENEVSEFDLRQAVIHAEILKAPYID